jgi:hypothetical protein
VAQGEDAAETPGETAEVNDDREQGDTGWPQLPQLDLEVCLAEISDPRRRREPHTRGAAERRS